MLEDVFWTLEVESFLAYGTWCVLVELLRELSRGSADATKWSALEKELLEAVAKEGATPGRLCPSTAGGVSCERSEGHEGLHAAKVGARTRAWNDDRREASLEDWARKLRE